MTNLKTSIQKIAASFHSGTTGNFLVFILLSLISLAVYANALKGPFMMDDNWIFRSDRIGYMQDKIAAIFFNGPPPKLPDSGEISFTYRPLSMLLPFAAYHVFKDNYTGYHVFNLGLFIIALFAIFKLLEKICRDRTATLIASCLFASHPINSLMVNYISAHIFSFQLILMVTSCLMFARHFHHPKDYLSLMISLACFYVSTLCHELSLSLPLFMTWIALTSFRSSLKDTFRKLLPYYATAAILGIIWFIYITTHHEMFLFKDRMGISLAAFAAGFTQLLTWYATKLVFLHGVVLMHVLPLDQINIPYGLSILGACILLLALTFRRWVSNPDILWGMGWFSIGLLTIIPGSMFQPSHGLTIEPHWLYFASLGLFLIVAKGISRFQSYNAGLPVILTVFLILGLGAATHTINKVWSDPITCQEYFLEQNPGFKKAQSFLGEAYYNAKRYAQAKPLLIASLDQTLADWVPYNALGVIASIEENDAEAIKYFEQAINLNPGSTFIMNNLGIALIKMNNYEEAEKVLKRAIDQNPWFLSTRINLASLYGRQKEYAKAVNVLKDNLTVNPNDIQSISLIAQYLIKQENTESAFNQTKDMIINARNPVFSIYLGSLFCEKKFLKGAELLKGFELLIPDNMTEDICRVLAGEPIDIPMTPESRAQWIEIGKTLEQIGRKDAAETVLNRLPPPSP